MAALFFEDAFGKLQIPVIVCEDTAERGVVFANICARLLLNPQMVIEGGTIVESPYSLDEILRFQSAETKKQFLSSIAAAGVINGFRANIFLPGGEAITVSLSAKVIDAHEENFLAVYFYEPSISHIFFSVDTANIISAAVKICAVQDADQAISGVLSLAGMYIGASRACILEEGAEQRMNCTYEWCGGVEPALAELRGLKREQVAYGAVMSGMYVIDDVGALSGGCRALLEKRGAKAGVMLPLIHINAPLGFLALDDCESSRKFSGRELFFLREIAGIIVSLITRRNAERQAQQSMDLLKAMSDNIATLICVSDAATDEIVFANKALTDARGLSLEAMLGRPCWDFIDRERLVPSISSVPDMASSTWDYHDEPSGKWITIKNAYNTWIDGRCVRIHSMYEITRQKEYEAQVKHYTSTDILTGVYNREWGYKLMRDMIRASITKSRELLCLVFIDIDGLKLVNDAYGHDMGDSMITQTVELIRTSVRQSDFICRWGGDEFIMLLDCDIVIARRIMDKITERMDEVNASKVNRFNLAFSYGITELTADTAASLDAVISYADKLMYKNKTQKRL